MTGCGKAIPFPPPTRGAFVCGAGMFCDPCRKAYFAEVQARPRITCLTCDQNDYDWQDGVGSFCSSCHEAGWDAAYRRGLAAGRTEKEPSGALTVSDVVSVLFLALAGAGRVWLHGYTHTIGFETEMGNEPYMGLVLRDQKGAERARGTIPEVLGLAKERGLLS